MAENAPSGNAWHMRAMLASDIGKIAGPPSPPLETSPSTLISNSNVSGSMIGSDGLPHDTFPHPRLWGTFPRVLGHYARGLGLFPLETAVYKMTGLTAKTFGLKDRGVLKEGAYADLCVFDAETVDEAVTFAQPIKPAVGITAVITNGAPVWMDGKSTGARPGRVLRRMAA